MGFATLKLWMGFGFQLNPKFRGLEVRLGVQPPPPAGLIRPRSRGTGENTARHRLQTTSACIKASVSTG